MKNLDQYKEMYDRSIQDPSGFWREIAIKDFYWETPPAEDHLSFNFDVRNGKIFSEWFKGGRTNLCYNALDRHVKEGNGERCCFIFEGNDEGRTYSLTYVEVLDQVSQVVCFAQTRLVWK